MDNLLFKSLLNFNFVRMLLELVIYSQHSKGSTRFKKNVKNKSTMQKIIYLTLFFLLNLTAQAQFLMDVPVSRNGMPLKHATAGGFNLPQFSEVDLNNDGTKDLLVYDRWAQIASTFINNGTPNQVDYVYAPEYMKRFPQDTRNFMLMRDYNCDGIEDIFFFNVPYGTSGGVGVWEGSYDANDTIQFVEVAGILKYDFKPLGRQYICIQSRFASY